LEAPNLCPYTFAMLLQRLGSRLLVIPMASIFLFFGGSTAYAPDCHIEPVATAHDHSASAHTHSHEPVTYTALNSTVIDSAKSTTVNYEMCFAVGFIVLLLFRKSRGGLFSSNVKKLTFSKVQPLKTAYQALGFTNLTHLKLGVIRV
jgi:hypothetical protein